MRRCLYIILILLLGTGCQTLRKKFVRKKKSKDPPPVYVTLKDYPEAPGKELYNDYYIFTLGWIDEFIEALKDTNSKRQKKALEEVLYNLAQIKNILTQEGQKELDYFYKEFGNLKMVIPYKSLMEKDYLLSKIELLRRQFIHDFRPSRASLWIR